MTDRPTPTCPYCGGEMRLQFGFVGVGYECIQCVSWSPYIRYTVGMNVKEQNAHNSELAYAAAMRRAEPVARVMTLEEFTQDENAVYVEDCYGNVEITIMRYIVPMRKPMYLAGSTFERDTCAYEIKTYGKKWRAWTAKPTDAQRAATAWEGEAENG